LLENSALYQGTTSVVLQKAANDTGFSAPEGNFKSNKNRTSAAKAGQRIRLLWHG